MTTRTEQIKRPGGRSAQVQAQVQAALAQLISEQGRDHVTVPAVAERAGVSASSIYRRWGDMSGLLAETATQRLDPNRPLADKGNLRDDLLAWVTELMKHLSTPGSRSFLRAAAALAGSNDTDCLRNRKAEADVLVARALARGEAAPEARQIVDHVVAPIVFRLVFGAAPLPSSMSEQLVGEALRLSAEAASDQLGGVRSKRPAAAVRHAGEAVTR
ncbi:TetR/AcrR family transcriptional regulator [soil metagenome]